MKQLRPVGPTLALWAVAERCPVCNAARHKPVLERRPGQDGARPFAGGREASGQQPLGFSGSLGLATSSPAHVGNQNVNAIVLAVPVGWLQVS